MARILIVDDDIEICKTLKLILEQAGYHVGMATNGRVALADVKEHPTDLVVTDIFMPDQDGIGTIMEIRKDFPQIKIIAISGGGRLESVDYLELALNVGAHKILNKPFGNRELVAAVRELLP